jgi:hypothetical protein
MLVARVSLAGAEETVAERPRRAGIPEDAQHVDSLDVHGVSAYVLGNSLFLAPDLAVIQQKRIRIPRLCAPIRSIGWVHDSARVIRCSSEPSEWQFTWTEDPGASPVMVIAFDAAPILLEHSSPATSMGDGSVMLHAHQARTVGEKLRYEPQWYKNTVGYWTVPTDYVTWELVVEQPGTYAVAVLQGCGAGQGGSDAQLTLLQSSELIAALDFKTMETGHFQNFRWNDLGLVNIAESGKYELRIVPRRIAHAALFDVRAIHLVRQADAR